MTGLISSFFRLFRETRCHACTAPFENDGAVSYIGGNLAPHAREATLEAGRLFCPGCAARILKNDFPLCALCGEALPRGRPQGLCGECSLNPPPWSSLTLVGIYHDLVRELIVGFKFKRSPSPVTSSTFPLQLSTTWKNFSILVIFSTFICVTSFVACFTFLLISISLSLYYFNAFLVNSDFTFL